MKVAVCIVSLLLAASVFAAGNDPVLAKGALQRCIGIVPGQPPPDKVGPSAATMSFCRQLPAWDVYEQAGQRFQAGDRAGAAKILAGAAQAGNPLAQLRLAMMSENGEGIPRNKKDALLWYRRAAAAGEPAAQMELGGYYEAGDGAPEDWVEAARWYRSSASQGWVKGEFAFGRAYEFGIGVPQSRRDAILWFSKAAEKGDQQGAYFARWLKDPTNNIGFRNDAEHNLVIAGKLRFGLSSNDPAGILFHNSAERNAWLTGLRNSVDRSEAQTMWQIRKNEYDSCRSGGGSNCRPPGPQPR